MYRNIKLFSASPFFVFSLLLILKIYMTQWVVFGHIDPVISLLTGLSSVWLVFGLIEAFAVKRKILWYIISNVMMTSIYFAAIMYYQYYGVIVTYHALRQVNQVTEVKGSVFYLLHPYFLFIFIDVIVFLLLFFFYKRIRDWGKHERKHARPAAVALALVSFFVCIAVIIPNSGSINEIKQADEMGILNYEIHAIITDRNVPTIPVNEITAEAIAKLKGIEPSKADSPVPASWKAAEGRNVIVIQIEAFQNFLLGLKVDGQEITPVLNNLLSESLYFPNVFQQAGQGNTADAEFISNTSFYVPPHGAVSDEYTDRVLPGLPRLFKAKGYQTATFHTNDVKFWNRSALYKSLGFDKYYDKSFFGDSDIVKFAASDEVLYSKTASEMAHLQNNGKPFYAQVISMSGHHPFDLPDRKIRITLPERYKGSFVNDYLVSQNYADYALGLFFDQLKKENLWNNSLFVLYGDHMGLPIYSLSDEDKALLHEIYGKDYTFAQMMNIPLIISAPGKTQATVLNQVGGQVDFMPTIANLAGISLKNQIYFGQDLLNVTHNLLPEHYYLPTGSFINDSTVYIPGNGYKDGTKVPLNKVGLKDAAASQDEFERAQKLFAMSNSYVQSLPKHD
jgi:lipoteichoic acid synthase